MNEQRCNLSQLVVWYRNFLDDGKSAAFVSCVSTRYSVETLQRMSLSPDHEIRRAAVLALGMVGGRESIETLGHRLSDQDRCVRLVAEIAFCDLTRRAEGAAAAQLLDAARRHTDGHRYHKAIEVLAELTEAQPDFADAWHQLAIVNFCMGHHREASQISDRTVSLNRYHFAAHALQGRNYLEMDRPARALRSFRLSFGINPSQTMVQGYIDVLSRKMRLSNLDDTTQL